MKRKNRLHFLIPYHSFSTDLKPYKNTLFPRKSCMQTPRFLLNCRSTFASRQTACLIWFTTFSCCIAGLSVDMSPVCIGAETKAETLRRKTLLVMRANLISMLRLNRNYQPKALMIMSELLTSVAVRFVKVSRKVRKTLPTTSS